MSTANPVPEWRLVGDWLDICSCNIPCLCEFARPPTNNACQGMLAWHIREGQPFARELGGRMHVFAHNGHLPNIAPDPRFALRSFRPVGETDSELAFCALLSRLEHLGRWSDAAPPVLDRYAILAGFAGDLRSLGPANFLYSDGEVLVAHADRRVQDNGRIAAPGLWMLEQECPAGG